MVADEFGSLASPCKKLCHARPEQMIYVRLEDPLDAKLLDYTGDIDETGAHVGGQRLQLSVHPRFRVLTVQAICGHLV